MGKFKSYVVNNPEGRKFPKIQRTFFHNTETDEIYISAPSYKEVIMASYDNTPMIMEEGNAFLPISWLRRVYKGMQFDEVEEMLRESLKARNKPKTKN